MLSAVDKCAVFQVCYTSLHLHVFVCSINVYICYISVVGYWWQYYGVGRAIIIHFRVSSFQFGRMVMVCILAYVVLYILASNVFEIWGPYED